MDVITFKVQCLCRKTYCNYKKDHLANKNNVQIKSEKVKGIELETSKYRLIWTDVELVFLLSLETLMLHALIYVLNQRGLKNSLRCKCDKNYNNQPTVVVVNMMYKVLVIEVIKFFFFFFFYKHFFLAKITMIRTGIKN